MRPSLRTEGMTTFDHLRALVAAVEKVPIVHMRASKGSFACVGCGRAGSKPCKGSCWVDRLERAATPAREHVDAGRPIDPPSFVLRPGLLQELAFIFERAMAVSRKSEDDAIVALRQELFALLKDR